jgi:hypothetical protein
LGPGVKNRSAMIRGVLDSFTGDLDETNKRRAMRMRVALKSTAPVRCLIFTRR